MLNNIAFVSKKENKAELPASDYFKCGDVVVNIEFTENAPDLQTILKNFYIKKKNT
jgi:hypothetical protein